MIPRTFAAALSLLASSTTPQSAVLTQSKVALGSQSHSTRLEKNGVRVVIVEDASRFARDLVAQELSLMLLISRGVQVGGVQAFIVMTRFPAMVDGRQEAPRRFMPLIGTPSQNALRQEVTRRWRGTIFSCWIFWRGSVSGLSGVKPWSASSQSVMRQNVRAACERQWASMGAVANRRLPTCKGRVRPEIDA
jgi:hypothetical protein